MRNFDCVDFKILLMDTFIRLHYRIQRHFNPNQIRIIKLFVNINIHYSLCGVIATVIGLMPKLNALTRGSLVLYVVYNMKLKKTYSVTDLLKKCRYKRENFSCLRRNYEQSSLITNLCSLTYLHAIFQLLKVQ